MNLSGAEIKGSLGAIPLFILLLIIVNTVMYFIGDNAYFAFLEIVSTISAYLLAILSLSFVFSEIILLLGLIIGIIRKLIFRR